MLSAAVGSTDARTLSMPDEYMSPKEVSSMSQPMLPKPPIRCCISHSMWRRLAMQLPRLIPLDWPTSIYCLQDSHSDCLFRALEQLELQRSLSKQGVRLFSLSQRNCGVGVKLSSKLPLLGASASLSLPPPPNQPPKKRPWPPEAGSGSGALCTLAASAAACAAWRSASDGAGCGAPVQAHVTSQRALQEHAREVTMCDKVLGVSMNVALKSQVKRQKLC